MRCSIVLLLLLCGCPADRDQVTSVGSDNPAMNAAIAEAKQSLGSFRSALLIPPKGSSAFAVKKGFPVADGKDTVEHIWINNVRIDGTNFVGTLGNDPVNNLSLRFGQRVTVASEDVSDWMYLVPDGGKGPRLVGGFSIFALYEVADEAERERMRAAIPFDITGRPVTK